MSCCSRAAAAYRGPLIVVGLGVGFVAVGAIPFAVSFCRGIRNSTIIIGVGFIGFGLLLVLPGLLWCLVRRLTNIRCCTGRKLLRPLPADDYDDQTPSYRNIPSCVLLHSDSMDSNTPKSVEHLERF